MVGKLISLIYNSSLISLLILPFTGAFSSAQEYGINPGGSSYSGWDYSLGDKEKFSKPIYSPLKKIEREVLYYPYTPKEETSIPQSPLGEDYYTYILPQKIFGEIETLRLEISEGVEGVREVKAEELVKEIEEALPIIMKSVSKRKEERIEQSYLLRLKFKKEREKGEEKEKVKSSGERRAKEKEKKEVEQRPPSVEEIDVLVKFIFGQGKVVIKIPPLKDPREKERLIKELERIASILVRQDELLRVEEIPE